MAFRNVLFFVLVLMVVSVVGGGVASASETNSSIGVVATSKQREQLRATPIVNRPNRPLHFYGNTVRWLYHRRGR